MENHPREIDAHATPVPAAELDQLGDEIAELSAHLEAATARLLHLIREFDARGAGTPASAPAPRGSEIENLLPSLLDRVFRGDAARS